MPLPPDAPDLRSLDLFASVVELGSVSQAARLHGYSQPSASQRLHELERRVGVTLLDRGPTGSTPTEAGQLVAGWAEAVLAAASDLDAGIRALRARTAGRIRIRASFTVAEYLLPGWLGRWVRTNPDHAVELAVANSADVLDAVRAGRADLGFVESTEPIDDLGVDEVGNDHLVAVVAPSHPWAGRDSIDVETLVLVPLVTREPGSGTRAAFEHAVRSAGLTPPPAALELGSTAAIKVAVAGGSSPAVLSRIAVEGDVASGRLVAVEIDGVDLSRPLRMVWRTDLALPAEVRALRDQLRT